VEPLVSRSEGAVSQERLLHYDALGWRLFRNNVGQLLDKRGIPVRYGLNNVSKAVNDSCKSSDYIGWRPLLITPDMVGDVIAQFCSIEFKHEGWTPARPTNRADYAHEQAQLKWLEMVRADGGFGVFDSGK
jgi:hypothetical protein